MKRLDWFMLALLVSVFWVFDVFFGAMLGGRQVNENLTFTCVGICIGQINLIGAWGALAPGKMIVRLPWAAFLGVLMWEALAIGQYFADAYSDSDRLTLGISVGFGVVVTQVPLWLARWAFRWRLLPPRFPLENLAETDAQFNLKHLFLGMFVASLALAMARFTLADLKIEDFGMDAELYPILTAAAIANALVTAPCIWMAYCSGWRLAGWAAAWVFYTVLVSAAELLLLIHFLGQPSGNGRGLLFVFTCLNLAQCLTVFATMMLLRWMGFRLIRVNQVETKPKGKKPALAVNA